MAVVALLAGVAAAPLGAQDSTRAIPDSLASWYRDPHTAQLLGSFIPGAGHLYAGEKLRGLGIGGVALFGVAAGIVLLNERECHLVTFGVESCDPGALTANRVNGITELVGGVAAWVLSAVDAPRAAVRENERRSRRVAITPYLRDDVVRQPALGVAVTVGW